MADHFSSETQQRFAQRLAILSYGRHPNLDEALAELKAAILANQSLADLDKRLSQAEAIADEVEETEKRARWQLNTHVLSLAQSLDLAKIKRIDLDATGASLSHQLEIVAAAVLDANKPPTASQAVRERIQDLLHCLRGYGREALRCEELLDELDKEATAWADILDETVAMTIQVLRSEQVEFEKYLGKLNEQLSEIRKVVHATQAQDSQFAEMEDRFSARLDAHVQRIESRLSEHMSLTELKQEVIENLRGIRADMGEFLTEQRHIRDLLRQQMLSLGNTVTAMADENMRQQRELVATRKNALTDALTGMPNRAAYEETWPSYVANARDNGLVLVVADIDKFKEINDQFGHQAGDRLLQVVAKLLGGGVRKADFVCRYGGEEFVILMSGATIEQAEMAMNKLRQRIKAARLTYKGQRVKVTCSFGIARWQAGEEFSEIFRRADEALYRAKREGRNRVACHPS